MSSDRHSPCRRKANDPDRRQGTSLDSVQNSGLDNLSAGISYPVMAITPDRCFNAIPYALSRRRWASVACLLCLSATGCLSGLHTQSTALAKATAPVIENAADAYKAAQSLHDLRVDYDAVAQFNAKTGPVYNPRTIAPLLTDKDIRVRLAVLAAFQSYTKSLVNVTDGTDSKELDAATKSVGNNLSALGNSIAPSIQGALNLGTPSASSTSSTPSPAISATAEKGIATAANALAQFLVSRKIKKDLPQVIQKMDPQVAALCELLEKDLDTLHDVESLDYDFILDQQTLFVRTAQLDPEQRREQVMKLPEIVRQQRETDQKVTDLKAAIVHLAAVHHTLANEAEGKNPESVKDKLDDLEAAGESLGKFYSSL